MFLALATLLTACHKKVESTNMGVVESADMRLKGFAAPQPQSAGVMQERKANNTLAYEHVLQIELAKELIAARVETVRAACMADSKTGCTLLEISNNEDSGVPEGRIQVRIAPSGVDTLQKLSSEGGRVTNRHTSAEDLAQPLADTERQLALLNLHRQRLTEFMNRKDMKVADLITVSRELATVQAQLEDFDSQHANLKRRVDTDLLSINWRAPISAYQSVQSPVLDALKSFGSNFTEAIGQAINFFAYALPWMVVIVIPGLILIRWFWKWLAKRRSAG
jgi:hypothetical protein